MKKCVNPNCKIFEYADGGLYINEQKHCFECGSELVKVKEQRCKCGNLVLKGHKFCTYCGLSHEEALKPKMKIQKEKQEKCPKCGAKMLFIEEFGHDVCPNCDSGLIA